MVGPAGLTVSTLGANFVTSLGPVTLDGFALYQFGHNGSENHYNFTVSPRG